MLIVLDNCEHLIGACAKLADTLLRRCPKVRLLATSREPLGIDGEVIYRVPSLSLPAGEGPEPHRLESSDAVTLFAARAAAQGVGLVLDDQSGPLVVSVCRRLDGMPLAIELAAARLRSMSLAELHARLDQRFRLLTGGSRAALPRHQTLRATIAWSYALLTGSEQALLGRLSGFADSFDLPAAESVCGFGDIDPLDVAELLGSLVDKSLVIAEQQAGRYRLLETIGHFAAEQLADRGSDGVAAVAAAHCQYYLSVAEAAAPQLAGADQADNLARLDADRANLQLAAAHAVTDPDGTGHVLRFGVALRTYWSARDRGHDGGLQLVLTRPEARADARLFARGLTATAAAATVVDLAVAQQLGEQALVAVRELGDDVLLIDALCVMTEIYFHSRQPEPGLALAQEAVQRARDLGNESLLYRSLLACLFFDDLLDPAELAQLYGEGMASADRSGNHMARYLLLVSASNHALNARDIPAARAFVDKAFSAMRNAGAEFDDLLIQNAWVLRAEQEPGEARLALEAALRGSRREANRLNSAYSLLGLAILSADAGAVELAAELHGAAQTALDRTGRFWQDLEAGYRQLSLQQVRAALSGEQFDRAYATGVALSPEAAISLALQPVRTTR